MSLYHKSVRPTYDIPYIVLLLLFETALTCLIVTHIPYTEIDWVAYMQEVSAYQNGERDYLNIRGDTGPLVYPAGFLYLYSRFKTLASHVAAAEEGGDVSGLDGSTSSVAVRKIQWVFAALYLVNSAVVLALYQGVLCKMRQRHREERNSSSSALVWAWRIAMGITCLSKRIHSIFVLRLFNDAPAMLLLHISMYLFACCDAWALGCVVFSLAVSIKMNVLLFAPGLLLLLLQKNESLLGTFRHLMICAAVQIGLGWPFLSTYPVSYIKKAFEFDRVFFFKWTVNWKFLPEELFVSKRWALMLMSCHLSALAWLARKWWNASVAQRGQAKTREWMCWKKKNSNSDANNILTKLSPEYVIYTMFVSNFIGVAFARTLHYQFYSWYFHSLPILHWIATIGSSTSCSMMMIFSLIVSTISIFGVEYAFNVYPATKTSSMVLQTSHALLLIKIFRSNIPIIEDRHVSKQKHP
ncbi:hypothetical protein ACHAW6_013726 [Cyclotella cf. meneghiniana]